MTLHAIKKDGAWWVINEKVLREAFLACHGGKDPDEMFTELLDDAEVERP